VGRRAARTCDARLSADDNFVANLVTSDGD
jgi:hypothetical protein